MEGFGLLLRKHLVFVLLVVLAKFWLSAVAIASAAYAQSEHDSTIKTVFSSEIEKSNMPLIRIAAQNYLGGEHTLKEWQPTVQ